MHRLIPRGERPLTVSMSARPPDRASDLIVRAVRINCARLIWASGDQRAQSPRSNTQNEDGAMGFCKLHRDGPILTVTMDKQERLNAMNAPDAREMSRIFDDYLSDPSLRVCIL